MSASIENPKRCNCGKDSWPTGGIADHANRDDVRRCLHGNIWRCNRPGFGPRFTRVSKLWEPLTYRRATSALDATTDDIGDGTNEGDQG